ncbi:MAG TPA: FecR family protein [Verrucomicrobiae bacterium]|nr:FecR family protein [Verrucomicrobiae bacterium]
MQRIAILALLVALAPAVHAADVGQIKTSKGGVVLVRDGQEIAAPSGTPIQQSDRVMTRADGSAGITFKDNSLLSLGPDSSLDISLFSFNTKGQPDAFEARLNRGTLSAVSGKIVAKSPEAMRIHTPTTILGVRGTEFFVQVTDPKQ